MKRKTSVGAPAKLGSQHVQPTVAAGTTQGTWLSCLVDRGASCRLTVAVVPQASRTGADGFHDGALRVRLAAAPIDGKANEALMAWLSETLGLPKRAVRVLRGATSRRKQLDIDLDAATAAKRLEQRLS